jgi:hypothetical protein
VLIRDDRHDPRDGDDDREQDAQREGDVAGPDAGASGAAAHVLKLPAGN